MPNAHAKRVVSLIASATEIICALGARDLLVARSHECDFPPDVRRLPSLTEPKFLTTGTSYEIDARSRPSCRKGSRSTASMQRNLKRFDLTSSSRRTLARFAP